MSHAETPPDANCGIPHACGRVVPFSTILLDNLPTAALFALGACLLSPFGLPAALGYLAYCLLAIVLFWRLICPHCQHFGTRQCPCGYGVVAARFFRRREGEDFRTVFARNIGIMFPCWFVPAGFGAYLLWRDPGAGRVALFAAFCLLGFVAIPLIAKLVGCRGCEIRDQCPWMSRKT